MPKTDDVIDFSLSSIDNLTILSSNRSKSSEAISSRGLPFSKYWVQTHFAVYPEITGLLTNK